MKKIKYTMRRRLTGFTLVEIAIVVVFILILATLSLVLYRRVVTRSENTEAIINLKAISISEEAKIPEEGTYLNASGAEEIEEELDVALEEKIFTYRVENATDEDYVAIAERKKPVEDAPLMIAMGPGGETPMYYYKGELPGGTGGGGYWSSSPYGGGGGGSGVGGGGISGGGLGGGSGGSTGGSGGSSGGSSGGGSGSGSGSGSGGSSGGGSGGGPSGSFEVVCGDGRCESPESCSTCASDCGECESDVVCGDGICEGQESCSSCEADCGECSGGGAIVDAGLMDAYNALKSSSTGSALGALLDNYNVIVTIADAQGAIAYWSPSENLIVVDTYYASVWSTGALASVLAHEATHTDYTYNPDYWIAETLARHPELSEDDLHIDQSDPAQYPWYSIDQEYNAFKQLGESWDELRDTANNLLDYVSWFVDQGEDYAKAIIRDDFGYGSYGLPEY